MVCKRDYRAILGGACCVHSRPGPGDRRKSVGFSPFPPSADSAVGLRRGRRRRCPSSEGDTLAMQAERPEGPMAAKVSTVISSGGARNRRGPPTDHAGPAAGRERRLDIHVVVPPGGDPCLGSAASGAGARVDRRMSGAAPARVDGKRAAGGGPPVWRATVAGRAWAPWRFRWMTAAACSGCCAPRPRPVGRGGGRLRTCRRACLELRIDGGGDRHAPCTPAGVWGDARRRPAARLSGLVGNARPGRGGQGFLMNLIASRAFCSGLTGTRLDQAVG